MAQCALLVQMFVNNAPISPISVIIINTIFIEGSLVLSLLLPTFSIVGDNIDKDVKPRSMCSGYQTCSLHYLYLYAVKDRIDLSQREDQPSVPDLACINVEVLLPSNDDSQILRETMSISVAHILKKHIPFLPNMEMKPNNTSCTNLQKKCLKGQQWCAKHTISANDIYG